MRGIFCPSAHLIIGESDVRESFCPECNVRTKWPQTTGDPPYWGTEGYGVDFGLHQYQRMADLANTMKGRMIISVNDIPEMRETFDGLTIERVDINYTVGGSGRSKTKSEELIYDVQGVFILVLTFVFSATRIRKKIGKLQHPYNSALRPIRPDHTHGSKGTPQHAVPHDYLPDLSFFLFLLSPSRFSPGYAN